MNERALTIRVNPQFLLSLCMALVLHAAISMLRTPSPEKSLVDLEQANAKSEPLKITMKSPEEMAQIKRLFKRVGKKDGAKDGVYVKTAEGNNKKYNDEVKMGNASIKRPAVKNIHLSDLNGTSMNATPASAAGLQIQDLKLHGARLSDFMKQNGISSNMNPSYANNAGTGIQIRMEVPEGVEPTELNEMEMMFYSFQRRMAIQYINTLLGHVDTYNRQNPHHPFPLTDTKELMSGKITFDAEGNIVRVQMVKNSSKQSLDDFFTDVLTELGPLPNPPKALIDHNQFAIYYTLTIER